MSSPLYESPFEFARWMDRRSRTGQIRRTPNDIAKDFTHAREVMQREAPSRNLWLHPRRWIADVVPTENHDPGDEDRS